MEKSFVRIVLELAFWLKPNTIARQNNFFIRVTEGKKYYCIVQGLTEAMKHFHGDYD